MKKIEAFIRHEAFEPIRTELLDRGFPSLSIVEAKGSGRPWVGAPPSLPILIISPPPPPPPPHEYSRKAANTMKPGATL